MTTRAEKTLYLDCFSGVSGDMFVGALVDLGAPPSVIEWETAKLGLEGVHLHFDRESRNGIEGVRFRVHEGACGDEEAGGHGPGHHHHHHHDHHHHHHDERGREHGHEHGWGHEARGADDAGGHGCGREGDGGDAHEHGHARGRSFAEIRELIEGSALSDFVRERAVAVFRRIAVAEGRIHGVDPERVTFHEVGAVDSIVDIVAACVGLEHLGAPRVRCGVLSEGTGFVRCAHGVFPVPAPATLEILRGVELRQEEDPGERITPTGAALVAEFAEGYGPMPRMRIERTGYGAGARRHPLRPNVLRAVLGVEAAGAEGGGGMESDTVVAVEANVDDATPEQLGAAVSALLAAGALDAAVVPALMKKGRPGHVVSALCAPGAERRMAETLMRETGTLGVRFATMSRLKLARSSREVETRFGPVTVKEGWLGGERLRAAPEFESCAAAAARAGVAVREVFEAALAEALRGR